MPNVLQVRSALRELRDSFGQLLSGRRAGVPAALLAAAARSGNAALQLDASKALLAATAALQSGTQVQVHFLMFYRVGCSASANLYAEARLLKFSTSASHNARYP